MGRKKVVRIRRPDLEIVPHYVVFDVDTGEVFHITKSFNRAFSMVLKHDNLDYFEDRDDLMSLMEG